MKIESTVVAAHVRGEVEIRGRRWHFAATIDESDVACTSAVRIDWRGRYIGGSSKLREEIAARIASKRALLWARALGRIPVGNLADGT
jgi:hypothetical protein